MPNVHSESLDLVERGGGGGRQEEYDGYRRGYAGIMMQERNDGVCDVNFHIMCSSVSKHLSHFFFVGGGAGSRRDSLSLPQGKKARRPRELSPLRI